MKILCFFALTVIVSNAYSKELTLEQIFKESKSAVDSRCPFKNDKILDKYYFTIKKETSVWFIAHNEGKVMNGQTLARDEYVAIQTNIQRIYKYYKNCLGLDKNKRRAECFHDISKMLKDARRDLIGAKDPENYEENRAKYGTLYHSHIAMSAHVIIVATYNLQYYNDKPVILDGKRDFAYYFQKVETELHRFIYDTKPWRLDQLSAVEICEVKLLFWKEFTQSCEVRWRRNANDEDAKAPGGNNNTSLDNSGDGNIAASISKDNGDQFDVIDEYFHDLEKVERIGGSGDLTKLKYKATVKDHIANKLIFRKTIEVDVSSRGIGLHQLHKEAMEERGKEEKKLTKMYDKFLNGTNVIIRLIITSVAKYLQ